MTFSRFSIYRQARFITRTLTDALLDVTTDLVAVVAQETLAEVHSIKMTLAQAMAEKAFKQAHKDRLVSRQDDSDDASSRSSSAAGGAGLLGSFYNYRCRLILLLNW